MRAIVRIDWALPALALLTIIAYLGTFRNDFVDFDDDRYVTRNSAVLNGLSVAGIQYAFTTQYTGSWIPLTWMSLQLDATLFGENPIGYHAVGLLLHVLNTLLFYRLLRDLRLSQALGAVTAALFAVHPLHVESVAWVSERKDVLSTFFLLLTLIAYVRYTRQMSQKSYLVVAGMLGLGLLAKPMLVTVPVLLLLIDFLVLNRAEISWLQQDRQVPFRVSFTQIFAEKLPLLGMVGCVAVLTIFSQKEDLAIVDFVSHPLPARICHAMNSYVWYLGKTFVPTGLCAFYPLRYGEIDWGVTAWSCGLLLSITAAAVYFVKERPYLLFGWAWFVISLVPVIGLLQVGGQAHADRFTYVPHLGLFYAITCLAAELAASWKCSSRTRWTFAAATLSCCAVLTVQQVAVWRDSVTLWTRANQLQPDNWMARTFLSLERLVEGNIAGARDLARQSLAIRPLNPDALSLLGKTYLNEGRWDYAQVTFLQALELSPRHRDSLIGMAAACHGQGEYRDAEGYLLLALEKAPTDGYIRAQLALLYAQVGQIAHALDELERVINMHPRYAFAWKMRGQLLTRLNRIDEAIEHFQHVVQIVPDDKECLTALGKIYHARGDSQTANRYLALAGTEITKPKSPSGNIIQVSATKPAHE